MSIMLKNKPHLEELSRGVMVKAMECGIVVREFELQSCYYVHFRKNTLGKSNEPSYSTRYGLNSITTLALNNPRRLIYY